jgi:glucose-6-phosphate isomerase
MKIQYDTQHAGIAHAQLRDICVRLNDHSDVLKDALNRCYESEYAALYAPYDGAQLDVLERCIEQKKRLNPTALWIIGIGGSNMGAMALYYALFHETNGLPIHWVDTVDPLVTHGLLTRYEQELRDGERPLLVIISKSGTTLVTAINAELFLDLLRLYNPKRYAQFVVVITDRASTLWHEAKKQKYMALEIPQKIGGRYSVFTAVGLFPLGMLSVSVRDVCAGALLAVQEGLQEDSDSSIQAALVYAQYQLGKNVVDHFVFGPRLAFFGHWYRQLMGESLGKIAHKKGAKIPVGIVPTVSIGSIDLHSVLQLYLAGPRDIFTCFVLGTAPVRMGDIAVSEGVYAGKTIAQIQHALFKGTQAAYAQQKVPFVSYEFELNAFSLGFFMQSKMLEMMHLGFLLGVNPFDQPEVELYKTEVKRLLA